MANRDVNIVVSARDHASTVFKTIGQNVGTMTNTIKITGTALAAGGAVTGGLRLAQAAVEAMKGNSQGVLDAISRLPFGLGESVRAAMDLAKAFSSAADHAERLNAINEAAASNRAALRSAAGAGVPLAGIRAGLANANQMMLQPGVGTQAAQELKAAKDQIAAALKSEREAAESDYRKTAGAPDDAGSLQRRRADLAGRLSTQLPSAQILAQGQAYGYHVREMEQDLARMDAELNKAQQTRDARIAAAEREAKRAEAEAQRKAFNTRAIDTVKREADGFFRGLGDFFRDAKARTDTSRGELQSSLPTARDLIDQLDDWAPAGQRKGPKGRTWRGEHEEAFESRFLGAYGYVGIRAGAGSAPGVSVSHQSPQAQANTFLKGIDEKLGKVLQAMPTFSYSNISGGGMGGL